MPWPGAAREVVGGAGSRAVYAVESSSQTSSQYIQPPKP